MGNMDDYDPDADIGKGFEAIPPGTYEATLIESGLKESKTGGKYIQLVWEILSGPYASRRIYDMAMRSSPNPTAIQIGNRKLKDLVGIFGSVSDTAEWHNKPLFLKIGTRVNKSNSDMENQVNGYLGTEPPAKVTQGIAQVKAAPKLASPKSPWR